MASPHVAGLAALILQAGNRAPSIDELRTAVMSAARRHPPAGNTWDSRYGMGRVDAAGTIARVLPSSPGRTEATLETRLPLCWDFSELLASMSQLAAEQQVGLRVVIEVGPNAASHGVAPAIVT